MPQTKRIHYATIAIMLLALVLSFIQFLCNRSLWLDEAMLALNIINKSYVQLLQPLDYFQVAPIAFLQIEKVFSTLIPNSEFGLRIFPLLCFWASVYLFYRITLILTKDAKITLLTVSLFCLNTSLMYYSSEVKQYMSDIFVCLLLYYVLLKEYKNNSNRFILLALLGAISIFLSNVSAIVLFTIAVYLIIEQIKAKKINYLGLATPFITWAVAFSFYYLLFIHHHPSKDAMLAYWSNCFMPLNIFGASFWDFCFYKTKMVFSTLLPFGDIWIIAFLFFIIGLYHLIKSKNRKILLLLLLPPMLQLVLSAFKIYPFDLRLILYQTGFYIIILSIGVMYIINLIINKTKKQWLVWLPIIFPLIVCLNLFKNYLSKTEEIKESIQFIESHIKPNEKVYVYYGAIRAFDYYLQTGKVTFKDRIIYGTGNRGNSKKYVEEIKNNTGSCWILFSHIHEDESSYITNALGSLYKRTLSYKTQDSEAYLYNLGNKQ
jgi:dolichyl-phosphate-mannose-protein mannosyltransferase